MKHPTMLALVAAVGVCSLALGPVSAIAQEQAASTPAAIGTIDGPALQTALEAARDKHKVPALGALIMDASGVLWQGVAGKRQQTSDEAVTVEDRWHLGSCTKAMTATLAARLIERGLLTWDTTLVSTLPDLKNEMKSGWDRVTLRQLLSHTAGIAREPMPGPLGVELREGDTKQESTREQRKKVARWLVNQELGSDPGTAMKYSNAGYMLAGSMLENVTDREWEELMREEVFAPLGIKDAGFGPPGTPEVVDQPRGHRGGGGIWLPLVPGLSADNPRSLGPAGTVHMTLSDWAKFVGLHAMADPRSPHIANATFMPEGYLKPQTVLELHTPAPGTQPPGSNDGYSLGWGVATRPWAKGNRDGDKGLVLTHAGSNTLWFCVAWVAPERNLMALATCNAAGDDAVAAADAAVSAAIHAYIAARK